MKHNRYLLGLALLVAGALPTFSQVSNDNEDGVYRIDANIGRGAFVPGQVLVKFKDGSGVQVRRNAKGQFRTASINAVDQLLQDFGAEDMEKLFPSEEAKPASQLRAKRAPNGTIVKERNLDKVFLVRIGSERPDSTMMLIERFKEMPDVEYAEPNYLVYITADMPTGITVEPSVMQPEIRKAPVSVETDATTICPLPNQNPLYFRQYGITQQNIHQLWNKPIINKKRPVIAILDTGVDINHPDLAANIWTNTAEADGETAYDDDGNEIVDDVHGWNFVDDYYDLTDRNGHGTHCAGIAAAVNNNIGVVGANPLAFIMPVKVINDRGQGDVATISRGIIYAANNGADVISMSIGGPILSKTEKDALDFAYQTSILVASAGNYYKSIYDDRDPFQSGTSYPAAYYLVLGVEASGSNLQRAIYSNYDPDGPIYSEDGIDGRNYEIMVPGDKIYSTLPGGKYNQLSGTSMSAPLLAGAISALQMVKDYPSKDVLYGDLIHLQANFAAIYSDDTSRMPKIDLVSMSVDDNVEGNSNIDGQVDVGEAVNFTPLLRNTWADATDIHLKLTVDELYAGFVEIVNPEVDFGHSLSAYGRAEAQTPIQVRFGNNIGDNTRVKFYLEVTYHNNSEAVTSDVYVTVNNMVKISGIISGNTKLTADHVYYVIDNLGIEEGATLTIEPGTRIEFATNTGISTGYGKLVANGTPEKPIVFTSHIGEGPWTGIDSRGRYGHELDTIRYCRLEDFSRDDYQRGIPYMEDCMIIPAYESGFYLFRGLEGTRNTIMNAYAPIIDMQNNGPSFLLYSNIVNNYMYQSATSLPNYSGLSYLNYFNNFGVATYETGKYNGKKYSLAYISDTPGTSSSTCPSYLGTAREDLIRPYVYEIGNAPNTYGRIDLGNMPTRPYAEPHGIVWKVVVNDKDAQDEYDDLDPLGVGKHKFEVYFNRPMNKLVAPQISFGVREPYTQNVVAEEGEGSGWNAEGTIYTAYVTITGKTQSDGVNRIYVHGAEDDEFFECPYEKTRFNINIQAAGSLATGFTGEAGLGKVTLTWNNENNDFTDAMGFNVYRYNLNSNNEASDTIRLNKEILDIEATEYIDYEVVPGETYYYYYNVLSTDLQEYDQSNTVAVTPETATLGDANGSGEVDVADVITTVNYAAGMEPRPFIFEAADMNNDQLIDILDVIGIIQKILNPTATAPAMIENVATYTIEDGVVYVDSPVALAGVQVQLVAEEGQTFTVTPDLDGFEHTLAWLSDEDYLFMAYNMSGKTLPAGKHALLRIGDAKIASIRLANAAGGNVTAVEGGTTTIGQTITNASTIMGIYNLHGQRVAVSADQLQLLPKGVYIVDGKKVIKWK